MSTPSSFIVRSLRGGLIVLLCASAMACTTPGTTSSSSSSQGASRQAGFVNVPEGWSVTNEKEGENLYQAQLASQDGASRILLGSIPLNASQVRDKSYYLNVLHSSLVDRIRGESGAEPFTEESIAWANGIEGLRTLLRSGEEETPVIIEGLTFLTETQAYFIYGRFPEAEYQSRRASYETVLASALPLQGDTAPKQDSMDVALAQIEEEQSSGTLSEEALLSTTFTTFPRPTEEIAGFAWGSARQDIESTQGEPTRQTPQMIAYQASFEGLKGVMVYLFTFDRMTRGTFVFGSVHDEANLYLQDFINTDQKMSALYGSPLQRATIWSNERYKADQSRWAEAVLKGDVVFGSVWQVDGVKVIHSLKSDGLGGVNHRIVYKNKKVQEDIARSAQ